MEIRIGERVTGARNAADELRRVFSETFWILLILVTKCLNSDDKSSCAFLSNFGVCAAQFEYEKYRHRALWPPAETGDAFDSCPWKGRREVETPTGPIGQRRQRGSLGSTTPPSADPKEPAPPNAPIKPRLFKLGCSDSVMFCYKSVQYEMSKANDAPEPLSQISHIAHGKRYDIGER